MLTSKPSVYIFAGSVLLSLGATKCGSTEDPGSGAQTTGTSTVDTAGTGSGTGTSIPTKKPDLSTAEGTGTGEACTPPAKWYVKAGCPSKESRGFAEFPSDCYLSCAQDPNVCAAGSLCRSVQFDPCLPKFEPGQTFGTQCDACMAGGKLCIPLKSGPSCADFAGIYETKEERECGKTPDGVAKCKWRLSFMDDGTFSWRFSDIFQSGQYFCHDSTIYLDLSLPVGGSGPNQSYTVAFDAATKSLVWEGATYLRVP